MLTCQVDQLLIRHLLNPGPRHLHIGVRRLLVGVSREIDRLLARLFALHFLSGRGHSHELLGLVLLLRIERSRHLKLDTVIERGCPFRSRGTHGLICVVDGPVKFIFACGHKLFNRLQLPLQLLEVGRRRGIF